MSCRATYKIFKFYLKVSFIKSWKLSILEWNIKWCNSRSTGNRGKCKAAVRNSSLVCSQRIINNSPLPFTVWKKGNYRRIKTGNISLTQHTYTINISVSVHARPNFVKGHIRFIPTSIRRSISMVNKFQMCDCHQMSTISILISHCCPQFLFFLPVIRLKNICTKREALQQHK